MAAQARGSRLASETSEKQFARMQTELVAATDDAIAAIRLDDSDPYGFALIVSAARMGGAEQLERRALENGLRREPASFTLRVGHLDALRPRWGGSFEEMDAFAAAAQQHVRKNPRLRVLLGFSAYERGEVLSDNRQFEEAIAAYTTALSFGEFWRYRMARGESYSHARQYDRALVDFNHVIAERPGSARALAWRSVTYTNLARLSAHDRARGNLLWRAREDLRVATELDPADDTVAWLRTNRPELLAGDASRPKSP
jgi:tetratricopeptide (TPR) repeat protein